MKLKWDQTGERLYETGVDRGVLYELVSGAYTKGVAWNGLIKVTENPSGAEPTKLWANNGKYAQLMSVEEMGLTIEAYTYPKEFEKYDGSAELVEGVYVGQQSRSAFGFSYRTLIGNDEEGTKHGYKLHLVYGCLASPSTKERNTVNESPDAGTFSWEVSTTPVDVAGLEPTAMLTIDSTVVAPEKLAKIEAKLYGDGSGEPTLPLPDEIKTILTTE